ncbi:MAG: hypothetical protein ACI3YO_04130 [Prevotella sp.]
MDENEKWLRSHYGNDNPFTVPEGYFESLSDSIMSMLPEQQTHVVDMGNNFWKRKIAVALAVAASVAVIISVSLTVGFQHDAAKLADGSSNAISEQQSAYSDYTVVDEMANYAMLDNVDMYAYVATNE